MEPATLWGLIISGVLAVGSVLGVVLTKVGKKGDQEQAQVTDQFKRMLDEVGYWQNTAVKNREEWETRWDRQMTRCRKITDKLVMFVVTTGKADPSVRTEAESLARDLADHNETDHDLGTSFRHTEGN